MIKPNYLTAALWFLSHVLISSINDTIAIYLGCNLSSFEITTLRFFFGTITLCLVMIPKGLSCFKTSNVKIHFIRSVLLFAGISIWISCLNDVPLVLVTLMSFTIPIFFIILAYFLLKEKIGISRLIITVLGFIGIIVAINPFSENFQNISLLLIIAVICFALLDVVNKKYVSSESTLNMMFYSALFTLLLSLAPTFFYGFIWPSNKEIILCFFLGAGANLILYTLLKAFALADATSLSPLRYTELLISALIAYFLFGQIPEHSIYIASLIIVPCNFMLIYYETKKE
jgi:S-adenosylmethionine uptake transporter